MKPFFALLLVSGAMAGLPGRGAAAGVKPSKWVYPSYLGDLLYGSDTNGVRINDFSNCGYKRGEVALPDVRQLVPDNRWIRLTPLDDGRDNADMINAALSLAGAWPANTNGFRGVVLLEAGDYRVESTLLITNNGVVLKGAGPSATLLRRTLIGDKDIIALESPAQPARLLENEAAFTEWLVPAGTRAFRVDKPAPFRVGDTVWVTHWAAWKWIRDLDMDKLNDEWIGVGSPMGDYERRITQTNGAWITVDSPVPQTFELSYGGGRIIPITGPDLRIENCGVEDLACYFGSNPGDDDYAHPTNVVCFDSAVNSWMRNVVGTGYFSSCVTVRGGSKYITVAECQMRHATNSTHHNRYSFRIDSRAGHVLVRDCYAEHSRHDYLTSSTAPGPSAFVRCVTAYSDDDVGPHQRWATGTLYDLVYVNDSGDRAKTSGQLNAQNRGNAGSGESEHGWAGAYIVAWNCYAEEGFRVRNPPTAVNWLIGGKGEAQESMRGCWWSPIWFGDGDCWAVGADPEGTYDQSGEDASHVQLRSLYYAQLQQKLKWPASEFREYRFGVIDQFRYSGLWDDQPVTVDPDWLQEARGIAGAPDGATNQFDILRANRTPLYTAFTFSFPVAPGEQVVAGSITLGLRLVPGATADGQRLYLESSDFSDPFSVLGWNVTTNASSVHTALVVPGDLQDGKLNVGIGPHCGVDFAVLHLQVAPVIPSTTQMLTPIDTYVRNGSYANQNFAGDPELILKEDSEAGFSRRAFLDWNLAEVKGKPFDAKVRLYCRYAGQAGNEQSAAVVREQAWSANSVTWNTQPAIPPAIAYWTPEPEAFVEFTVTPEVNAALSAPLLADRRFALALRSVQDFGGQGDVAYASREDPDPSQRPQLILRFTNSPPTIVVPGNVTMNVNSTVGPLAVTIGDSETPAANLTLSITGGDFVGDVTLGGSGSNRTVTLTTGSRAGGMKLTLTVSDGIQGTSASFFINVRVNSNTPPAITPFANLATDEDTPYLIPFIISDSRSRPSNLDVAVSTSNRLLFPPGSIQRATGSGDFAYLFTPAPNRSGVAALTVVASDGFLSATQNFILTVRSVEDPPTAVRMETPRGGDNLLPGVPASLHASAFDAEANLARFQFYRQHPSSRIDELIGVVTNISSSATWSNPPPGDCNLYAIAIDRAGLAATSPPVSITVSVPEVIPPRLVIGQASNSVVVLWPLSLSSNALKTTTNLSAPILWSPLSSAPYLGEGAWIYNVPRNERKRFFRLAE